MVLQISLGELDKIGIMSPALLWMSLDFVIDISQSVVHIHFQLGEESSVLSEHIFKVNLDTMSKNNWIRDLHHCCLHVERHHQLFILAVLNLGLKKRLQCFDGQLGCVYHLPS